MPLTPTTDHALPVPGTELTDLYCVAALATAGLNVARIERRHGRAVFTLAPDERLSRTVQDYYRGALLLPARSYADAIRGLKAAIHAPALAQ